MKRVGIVLEVAFFLMSPVTYAMDTGYPGKGERRSSLTDHLNKDGRRASVTVVVNGGEGPSSGVPLGGPSTAFLSAHNHNNDSTCCNAKWCNVAAPLMKGGVGLAAWGGGFVAPVVLTFKVCELLRNPCSPAALYISLITASTCMAALSAGGARKLWKIIDGCRIDLRSLPVDNNDPYAWRRMGSLMSFPTSDGDQPGRCCYVSAALAKAATVLLAWGVSFALPVVGTLQVCEALADPCGPVATQGSMVVTLTAAAALSYATARKLLHYIDDCVLFCG